MSSGIERVYSRNILGAVRPILTLEEFAILNMRYNRYVCRVSTYREIASRLKLSHKRVYETLQYKILPRLRQPEVDQKIKPAVLGCSCVTDGCMNLFRDLYGYESYEDVKDYYKEVASL